jgi:hypothetical protein
METQQNQFEGWAVVEMFGHQKIAGRVSTEVYGQACLFRVDVPEMPERQIVLEHYDYIDGQRVPPGSKVQRPAEQPYSKLIGPGAVYAINPCNEATVREYLERERRRPLVLLELATAKALPSGLDAEIDPDDEDEDDDVY